MNTFYSVNYFFPLFDKPKKFFFLFSFFFFLGIWDWGLGSWNFISAQSVGIFGSTNLGVNSTGAKGVASSVFDISATGKGLLIPRMATAFRPASPALSLLIFNTDLNQYEYWDGAAWVTVAAGSGPWNKSGATVFLTTGTDNVGIGINPATEKLEVSGNIRYSGKLMPNGSSGGVGDVLQVDGAGNNIWTPLPSGSSAWIYNGGLNLSYNNPTSSNVGIGNSSPAEKLDISGNIRYSGKLMPNGSAGGIGDVLQVDGAGNNIWTPLPSGSSAWIYNGGLNLSYNNPTSSNVGIGNSSPAEKLDISGNIRYSGKLMPNGSSGGVGDVLQVDGAGNNIWTPLPSGSSAWIYNGGLNLSYNNPTSSNVGIGNSSPAEKLDISGNIRYSGKLMPNGSAGGVGDVLTIDGAGNNIWTPLPGGANIWSRTAPYSYLTTGTDNVGIGTTTPNFKLHVVADDANIKLESPFAANNEAAVMFFKTGEGTPKWVIGRSNWGGSNADNFMIWEDDDNVNKVRLMVAPGGNVGIGTTAPVNMLQLYRSSNSSSSTIFPSIGVHNSLATQGDGSSTFNIADIGVKSGNGTVDTRLGSEYDNPVMGYVGTVTAHPFSVMTSGNRRMTIDASGNVGIGTTAPFTKFQVAGDNTMTSSIMNSFSAGGYQGGLAFVRTRGTVAAPSAVMSGDVLGRINFNGLDNTSNLIDDASIGAFATENFTGTAHGTTMTFHTTIPGTISKTEKMRIDGNGNVGIGTTSPNQKLTVAGNFGIRETGASPTFHSIFQGGDQTDDITYTLPAAQGGANTVLQNNGSGTLSWATISGTLSGGTTNYVAKWTGATTLSSTSLLFDDGTNVGIGTTTVSEKLHVIGNALFGTTSLGIKATNLSLQQTGSASNIYLEGGSSSGNVFVRPGTTGTFYVELPSTTKLMTVLSNGNVGIGTTSPTAKLDIHPSAGAALNIQPFGAGAGQTGELHFYETIVNGDYVGFKAPDVVTGNTIWTLPAADGGSGSVLSTNGSGTLSWTSSGLLSGGTIDYIPKWTSGTSLGNSAINDNGTRVSISSFLSVGASSPPTNQKIYAEIGGASSDNGMRTENAGTGVAGIFNNSNSSNSSDAVTITTNGSNSKGLNISHTGTGGAGTDYGLYVTNTGASASTANVGGYFTASGATNNYAAIFDAGNVGIGTTAPGQKLHIANNATSAALIQASSAVSNEIPALSLMKSQGTVTSPTAVSNGNALGILALSGHDGTSFGSEGSAYIMAIAAENFTPAAKGADLSFYTIPVGSTTAGNPKMIITNSGNIGIGTTLPFSRLHLKGTNYTTLILEKGNNSYLGNISYQSATGVEKWAMGQTGTIGFPSDNDFALWEDGTIANTRFFVKAGGNVGIGTTTPAHKLHTVTATAGARAIYGENTDVTAVDGYGLFGKSINATGYGVGVRGEGGFKGVEGIGSANGYGVAGINTAAGSDNTGVYGEASGGTVSNWGGYFKGNVNIENYLTLNKGTLSLINGANNNIDINSAMGLQRSYYSISGPTAAFTISGFDGAPGAAGGRDGRVLIIYNTTAQNMTIAHQVTSAAENQIITNTGGNVTSAGQCMAIFIYDIALTKWILVSWNP